MARLGVLKPLRGTESSLANVVLEDGEVAFSYPTTGPGTGLGGIKMGDGVKTFSSLPWYITGEGSGPTPWEYDTDNNEAALLNNIKHPEYETIGKIYYIQSYFNNSESESTSSPTITQSVPYKVIAINHEDTSNTVDLMSMVTVNWIRWRDSRDSWTYGKYTESNVYNWISITCPQGYSEEIQSKMINMTERWREATSNTTGTMQSRSTKCKLLNPYEMFGSSCNTYNLSDIGTVSDFTTYDYGQHYSDMFPNSIVADNSRIIYRDLNMTTKVTYDAFLNSYYGYTNTSSWYSRVYSYQYDGGCQSTSTWNSCNISPVIRLSSIL